MKLGEAHNFGGENENFLSTYQVQMSVVNLNNNFIKVKIRL